MRKREKTAAARARLTHHGGDAIARLLPPPSGRRASLACTCGRPAGRLGGGEKRRPRASPPPSATPLGILAAAHRPRPVPPPAALALRRPRAHSRVQCIHWHSLGSPRAMTLGPGPPGPFRSRRGQGSRRSGQATHTCTAGRPAWASARPGFPLPERPRGPCQVPRGSTARVLPDL